MVRISSNPPHVATAVEWDAYVVERSAKGLSELQTNAREDAMIEGSDIYRGSVKKQSKSGFHQEDGI